MKKTLLACALLAAASSAMAADVTLYGVADVGLRYSHKSTEHADGSATAAKTSSDKTEMMSGQNAGSRFGLKGAEDLGNGVKVGFQLEGQYNVDDGTLKNEKFFHRQSSLWVAGDFGRVEFGRMGTLSSAAGTYDLFFGTGDAFDGGDGLVVGALSYDARRDNTVTYQTPTFAGVTGYAQYSFGKGTEKAQEGSNERYMGVGLKWQAGALTIAGTAETVHWANNADQFEDKVVYGLSANYDVGVTRIFGAAQYVDGADNLGGYYDANGIKGCALQAGAVTPVPGGSLTVSAGWADGEHEPGKNAAKDFDLSAWSVSARYVRPFSKTFSVYCGAGFQQIERDFVAAGSKTEKSQTTQVYAGLTKKF